MSLFTFLHPYILGSRFIGSIKLRKSHNFAYFSILEKASGRPNRTEFTEYRSFGSVLFGSVRFGIFGKYRTESVRNAISELGINFYNIWI